MSSLETEFIKIPKSHLKSMNTRFRGIKNLIRINVAQENELRILQNKYQKMEAEHLDMVQESKKMTDFSVPDNTQPASCPSILPKQNSCPKAKADSISEETYFDILTKLCHATSVIRELKEKEPSKTESGTQTGDINSPMQISDVITEQTNNCRSLQSKMEEQQLELESSIEKIEKLTKQLEEEKSVRKSAVENEKKHKARLQREQEQHQKTQQKLQDIKAQLVKPKLNADLLPMQRCLPQMESFVPQLLTVDCDEKDVSLLLECPQCHQTFSTNEEVEYHKNLCEKSKENLK